MSNTQLYSRNADGITYSSPTSPSFIVRFRTRKSSKSLDGLKTNNVRTEIIINDKNLVSRESATADDACSVRVHISGSELSHARLSELLKGVAAQLPVWADENVILGFEPSTVPVKY